MEFYGVFKPNKIIARFIRSNNLRIPFRNLILQCFHF